MSDRKFPSGNPSIESILLHLGNMNACEGAIKAVKKAHREYLVELGN
jgi:hypothetical protein